MKVAEKIEPEIDHFGEGFQKLIQANIRSDYEPAFNNVITRDNGTSKIKEDQQMRETKLDRKTTNIQSKSGCNDLRMQYKYFLSNACEQQNYGISIFRKN